MSRTFDARNGLLEVVRGMRPAQRAATIAMIGSFAVPWLPWVQTGSAQRNSYEVFRTAQRLGLDELTPLRVVWFLVPVMALVSIFSGIVGRARVSGVLAMLVGMILGVVGSIVVISGLAAGVAPWAAVAIGVAATVVGGFLVWNPQGQANV